MQKLLQMSIITQLAVQNLHQKKNEKKDQGNTLKNDVLYLKSFLPQLFRTKIIFLSLSRFRQIFE